MILNLTQHPATSDQVAEGVVNLKGEEAEQAAYLLTFTTIPDQWDIIERAVNLAAIAKGAGAKEAMIGGAPYLMAPLEKALLEVGITPLYAFSKRESAEKTLEDGSVIKTNKFVHLGFVASAMEVE